MWYVSNLYITSYIVEFEEENKTAPPKQSVVIPYNLRTQHSLPDKVTICLISSYIICLFYSFRVTLKRL